MFVVMTDINSFKNFIRKDKIYKRGKAFQRINICEKTNRF